MNRTVLVGMVLCLGCGESVAPPAPIASLSLSPRSGQILPGEYLQLAAVPLDSAGDPVIGLPVRWASSDSAVASVSSNGAVRGIAVGRTLITATVGALVEGATVDVVPPVDSVSVAPSGLTIVVQGLLELRATLFDSTGGTLSGRPILWTSSDTTVAVVSDAGRVTGRTTGSVTITARSGSTADDAVLSVRTVAFETLDISEFGLVCGVTSDSAGFCWNSSDFDQGNGGRTSGRGPIGIASLEKFRLITGGEAFACGLATTGTAYCWGLGGRLGDGGSSASSVPVAVSGAMSFTTLSSGHSHTCGLTTNGDAYCWGRNVFGALGVGTNDSYILVPTLVTGGLKFLSVSAGVYVTCGLAVDSTAYCWGFNYRGQLGTGDSANRPAPTPVSGGLKFRSLVTASEHSCGIATTGDAYCWGSNHYGELGTGDSTGSPVPVAVAGGVTFTSISPGGDHGWNDITCSLTAGGTAYCWGYGADGTLGNGVTANSPVPVQVSGGLTFGYLIAGSFATCGITTGAVTYCWGVNNAGRLGTVDTSAIVTAPSRVLGQP